MKSTPVEDNAKLESIREEKENARSGIVIQGKKIRIVFKEGRDLNIFDIQSFNVDGQWWRITSGEGRFYIVDPAKVNYTETTN